MKCQSCNHVNKDGTKFCESCGSKLETVLKEEFCGSCNKPNPSNFKFCKHCGAARDALVVPSPASANYVKSDPKQSATKFREDLDSQVSKPQKKGAPWTLIILAVVILVGAAYFFIGKSGKNKDAIDASSQRPANASQLSVQAGDVTPSSLRGQAMPYIKSMLTAIQGNDQSSLDESLVFINGLVKPASGDRKVARKFNDAGLAALKINNLDLAVSSFKDAVNADLIDQEATNNLGYAYYLSGDLDRAKGMIEYTLALAPLRTSAWTNYAVILFKQGNEQAVNAYLIAYKYAKNQDRLIAFLEKQAQEDPDLQLRPFYSQVLTVISQRK